MKLPVNRFKAAIKARDKQIGIWNAMCSNIAAEILSPAGFDWALLDMEHSPSDLRTVLSQLQAYETGETTAIVRPTWNDPVLIKPLLDMGTMNMLVPMVQTPEEAAAAVAATRYPPRGVRGVSLNQRGNKFTRITDYIERFEEEFCLIVQIETQSSLAQVAEIAAVDGVDGIFFGPADLSADMDIIGQLNNDDLWTAIMKGVEDAENAGKPCGTLVGNGDKATELLNAGFTFVACGTDTSLLARSADGLLESVKQGIS